MALRRKTLQHYAVAAVLTNGKMPVKILRAWRWQDCALMRSQAAIRGIFFTPCIPKGSGKGGFVARFALRIQNDWLWQIARHVSKSTDRRRRIHRAKIFWKGPFRCIGPSNGARRVILPSGVGEPPWRPNPVPPKGDARRRSASAGRRQPRRLPAPQTLATPRLHQAAFGAASLCSVESTHPPYIFIRRTRGGVFQLMLQEQLRFLPPRRMSKRAVRFPWCTGPNPLAISTSSMRKARQSLSTTTLRPKASSRSELLNMSTVSRCTRLISPSFALQSMSVY